MTIEVTLPLDNYPNGETVSQVVDIPDEATECRFAMLRCTAIQSDIWPDPETHVTVTTEMRVNGVWSPWPNGDGDWWGGVAKNKFGQDIIDSSFSGHLPAGVDRQARATITVESGPLRTEASFDFFVPE